MHAWAAAHPLRALDLTGEWDQVLPQVAGDKLRAAPAGADVARAGSIVSDVVVVVPIRAGDPPATRRSIVLCRAAARVRNAAIARPTGTSTTGSGSARAVPGGPWAYDATTVIAKLIQNTQCRTRLRSVYCTINATSRVIATWSEALPARSW